MTSLTIYSSQL